MNMNWKAAAFDPENARILGEAAEIAYKDADAVEKIVEETWEMELLEFFDTNDTQAFLARTKKDDGGMILAFRGTESLRDWMTDIDITQVNGPGGKVHDGFNSALNSVWRKLWKVLNESRGHRSLWITGHSLGAALATLATAKMRLEKEHPINGLYTFGSPRVGNDEFARNFDNNFWWQTFRFVNDKDVVPRVPFRTMNYRHVGTFKFFNNAGKEDNTVTWDDLLLDKVKGNIADVLEPSTEGAKDHSMFRYVANLMGLPSRDEGIRSQ